MSMDLQILHHNGIKICENAYDITKAQILFLECIDIVRFESEQEMYKKIEEEKHEKEKELNEHNPNIIYGDDKPEVIRNKLRMWKGQ